MKFVVGLENPSDKAVTKALLLLIECLPFSLINSSFKELCGNVFAYRLFAQHRLNYYC